MSVDAPILSMRLRTYRGGVTDPDRWSVWLPRRGDILVTTPPKCGTTWTQTILAMLLHGGSDLPEPVPVLSPWVDADLGPTAAEVAAALARQTGRRVVKTHAPADGFPVWDGVTVVAVYRHPLDVFFSLRRHIANRAKGVEPDHPMLAPVPEAIGAYLDDEVPVSDWDRDGLGPLVRHFRETVLSGRVQGLVALHYADMRANPRAAVASLAEATGIAAGTDLIDRVVAATSFGAMKAKAAEFAPVAGTGFWKSDAGFFDSGSSGKWAGRLTEAEIARFDDRLAALLPDAAARRWLCSGGGLAG